jgi:SAM-dependent methyltransferase
MPSMSHWDVVYASNPAASLSWYQAHAECSLRLIAETGVASTAAIIDVGGGASTLVDDLLDRGYSNLSVLDVSAAALAAAQARLGPRAGGVRWIEADIVTAALPARSFDVWHDRAVFHFLTDAVARQRYVAAVRRAVKARGHVIVATFAEDGPEQCSGLPVMRYSPQALHAAFGDAFVLLHHEREIHATPAGAAQSFIYCRFQLARD